MTEPPSREPDETARPFRPAPFLRLTAALHLAGVATVALSPSLWLWILGGLVANHAAMAAAGCWPRSRLLGPNLTRLATSARTAGQIALTFDDGPDPEVTPRVLDLLDRHQATATFFCVGRLARDHPQLVADIAARGHTVANHSESHSYRFGLLGLAGIGAEIDGAQTILTELAGRRPRFFRPPAGIRSPLLEPVLARRGLHLSSWTRRGFETVDSRRDRVLARLTRNLESGDILLLHDGVLPPVRRVEWSSRLVLQLLPELLERLDAAGLRSVALTSENSIT